jgi:hypothetical protein
LIEAQSPVLLELPHPKTIANHVGRINDELYQIVTDEHASMAPMTFDFLSLVTGSAKIIDDLQNCFYKQFRRHVASVIE